MTVLSLSGLLVFTLFLIPTPESLAYLIPNDDFPNSIKSPTDQIYRKAYKQFSQDLFSLDPNLYKASGNRNLFKVGGIVPFSIGHLLATIAEQKYWELGTQSKHGLQKALRLSEYQITEAYESMLSRLNSNDDPNTFSFSSIFAAGPLTPTPELDKLSAGVVNIGESWDEDASTSINTQIVVQTFGQIYGDGDLVPPASWYGPGLGNYTKSAFTNTLSYSNAWAHEDDSAELTQLTRSGKQTVTNIGKQTFEAGDAKYETDFISYEGAIGYKNGKNHFSVGIPMKDGKKVFVLAQPKVNIEDISSQNIREMIDSNPYEWDSATRTKLEFPKLNFSFYSTPMKQLYKMGMNSTFCNVKSEDTHFLQQISQKIYLYVDEKGIVAASATGVELDNVQDYNTAFKDPFLIFDKEKMTEQNLLDQNSSDKRGPRARTDFNFDEIEGNLELPKLIKFNQPFFWYMYDNQLGEPLFFGSVQSFKMYKDKVEPEEYELLEKIQSFAHWSCQFSVDNPTYDRKL